MPLILIIILSGLAGSVITLLAIWAATICLRLDEDREVFERMQHPSEMTGRQLPLIH